MNKEIINQKIDAVARFLIYLFIAECTFGSSGRWFEIGPISIRILLFVLCFFATLPAVFRNIKELCRNYQVLIVVFFGIYIMICAAMGISAGNSKNFIWADVSTIMALALFPGFISVMCNNKSITKAINIVFWVSVFVSACTVLLHLILAFIKTETIIEINDLINKASLGGLASMQTGMQRLYMKSQIFLQVAIIYGIWKIGKSETRKNKTVLYLCEGLLVIGCILSYTRGFWIGLAASALLVLLTGIKSWKQYLKIVCVMMASLVAFLAISWAVYRSPVAAVEIVNRFDPSLIVINGINTDITDFDDDSEVDKNNLVAVSMRAESIKMAKKEILKRPVFGNGLGKNLDKIRNDGKIEYMYIDMTMKTGVVGTALFVVTFFGFILIQINQEKKFKKFGYKDLEFEDNVIRNRLLIAAYLGVAVTSFFNPFLNNPMGIMLLMLTVTAVYNGRLKNSEV